MRTGRSMRARWRDWETAVLAVGRLDSDADGSCTRIVLGTVSERPKVQLSKSCVGVEPTVGSNPTGSARGLLTKLPRFVCESQL
jgi:hypothetical protein